MVVIESLPFIHYVCSIRFANNYICALTETVKSLDTGLPPNLPVTQVMKQNYLTTIMFGVHLDVTQSLCPGDRLGGDDPDRAGGLLAALRDPRPLLDEPTVWHALPVPRPE